MSARNHLVYLYLLTSCLALHPKDREAVNRTWLMSDEEIDDALIVSAPSFVVKTIVIPALAETFDHDLKGVPGFYYDYSYPYCNWRINIPDNTKLLRPYTDERGRILGLYVYDSVGQYHPRLLTSRGLTLGSPAIQPLKAQDRSIAA